MPIDLATARARLRKRVPKLVELPGVTRLAAVAAVLRQGPDGVEVLLIRRAVHERDPWSGHMAFPGGKAEPQDRDLLATAMRETHEELGLSLERHEFLGRLDDVAATAMGRFTGMVIAPHVFALTGEEPLRPNHEVAGTVWVQLGPLMRGEWDGQKRLDRNGKRVVLPAYAVGDFLVWGLTYRMLRDLLGLLRGDLGA